MQEFLSLEPKFRPWGELKEKSNANTIFVDCDRAIPPALRDVWRTLRLAGVLCRWVRYDRTRRGWHIVIRVRESLSPLACVALQCVLGSDLEREKFNLGRVMSDAKRPQGKFARARWNILYRAKVYS